MAVTLSGLFATAYIQYQRGNELGFLGQNLLEVEIDQAFQQTTKIAILIWQFLESRFRFLEKWKKTDKTLRALKNNKGP